MRNVVAISLPDNLVKSLNQEAKEEQTSKSEIVRDCLKKHFAVKAFTKTRQSILKQLDKKGISVTEEEIFKKIS